MLTRSHIINHGSFCLTYPPPDGWAFYTLPTKRHSQSGWWASNTVLLASHSTHLLQPLDKGCFLVCVVLKVCCPKTLLLVLGQQESLLSIGMLSSHLYLPLQDSIQHLYLKVPGWTLFLCTVRLVRMILQLVMMYQYFAMRIWVCIGIGGGPVGPIFREVNEIHNY